MARAKKPRRIAIFSDPHGNEPGLRACIKLALDSGANEFSFLGDGVNYFGHNTEILDFLMNMGANRCITGNHEEMLHMAIEKGYRVSGIRDTFKVTEDAATGIMQVRKQILSHPKHQEYRKFLSGLQDQMIITPGAKGIHGFREFDDDTETYRLQMKYVMPPELASAFKITDKELCEDPEKVIGDSEVFDDNTYVAYTGHLHGQFLMSIGPQGNIAGSWIPDRANLREQDKRPGLIEIMQFRPREKAVVGVGAAGGISKNLVELFIAKAKHPERFYPGENYDPMFVLPANFVIHDVDRNAVEFYEANYSYLETARISKEREMPNLLRRFQEL